ncbi:LysR substrate-binding domain-containing protein [Rhodobacteraceae bacterium]|nr:LysR substrate-binding domain-containing protein [Paracoccaceae bacterium]
MGNRRLELAKLSNLIAFDAAARTKNFSKAGKNIGVSRVAISRQISDLEIFLDTHLFVRGHRENNLTEAGKELHIVAKRALDDLSDVMTAIQKRKTKRLSVTLTNALATYWLMPRLGNFTSFSPSVELNLIISDAKLDLEAEDIDVAVRYTSTPPEFADAFPLFGEVIFPVYSPEYKPRTPLETTSDLLQEQLLILSGNYKANAAWKQWFDEQGLEFCPTISTISTNSYSNMIQAAIEGQGIALAGFPMVGDLLEKGRLIRNQNFSAVKRDCTYLIVNSNKKAHVSEFCEWIEQEAEHCKAAWDID